jgi:hypothetical protein
LSSFEPDEIINNDDDDEEEEEDNKEEGSSVVSNDTDESLHIFEILGLVSSSSSSS